MSLDHAAVESAVRALDPGALAGRRWFINNGAPPADVRLGHAFLLADDVVLALVDLPLDDRGRRADRYAIPFMVDAGSGALREAEPGDGAWRALTAAIAGGRTIPAMSRPNTAASAPSDREGHGGSAGVEAALVCRPSPSLAAIAGSEAAGMAARERPLGRDQSNTSAIIGDRLLLKLYRRVQPGLNPDLELTAFLSEEAGFPGVPRLGGWAEVVSRDAGAATVAMLEEWIADGEDAYESTAERLAALVAAPGTVSLEWATEVAADLGAFTAGLHAALARPPADAPDLAPREATRAELDEWRSAGHRELNAAIAAVAAIDEEAAAELRGAASGIAARLSRFAATASVPLVTRIHGDLHLGQVLASGDGFRVIDFEGELVRPIDERRAPGSPLRDVASMLRSLDHVARSARRRALARADEPIEEPGLDVEAWIVRARERFLAAYLEGLRQAGTPMTLDPDLLDAFEVAKETYEFRYAATVLPTWLWAPREGMRWLLAHGDLAG